jgi:protein-S-isoprenylcysteine O-methyltransferase Ste14
LPTLVRSTLARASTATTQFPGTRNLHALLVVTGLQRWLTLISAIIFVTLGALICFLRRANIWVLLGIAALVARMWTYHRVYDDVLIALAELALFQIAKRESSPVRRKIAGALLLLMALAMLCPARFLDYSKLSWSSESIWICAGIHTLLWLSTLAFLINYARFDSKRTQETGARVMQFATS